jgi:predicted phage replisome organizer
MQREYKMADVKWIKIVTDIFDDEKMLLIESLPSADSIIVIWFKLLCMAGKNNNNGVFMLNDKIPYTEEMLATIFRRDINTVRMALDTFEKFGMIEVVDGVVTIPNWGKHQSLDRIEQKNEYMRGYMRDYRAKQKEQIECKTNVKVNVNNLRKSNVREADIEEEK